MLVHQKKLPGLNGLRTIAASLVLLSHVVQITGDAGDISMTRLFEQHKMLGKDMVNLFFVISGFIITWLLLHEKKKTGTISLKRFYFKRILRIWPLYFGIILAVFLLNRFTDVFDLYPKMNGYGLFLLLTFLLNIRDTMPNPQISVLQHYWSLSIEEQFYIFWPPVFKYLKERAVLIFAVVIVITMILLRNTAAWAYAMHPSEYLLSAVNFLITSMFGSISIGIIGAWLLFHGHPLIKFLYRPAVQVISWLVLLVTILFSIYIPYVHSEITAVAYMVIILNVTANPATILKVENRFFDKTGTISYGLYMFHWPMIPLIILAVKKAGLWELCIRSHQIPMLILCYGIIWLMAWVSYRYFESFFLRMRPEAKS